MADEQLNQSTYDYVESKVIEAEKALVKAKDLLDFCIKAGVDITESSTQITQLEKKINRYKIALEEKKHEYRPK